MRITFVTPHQRLTSGGVYAIHQYARLLAANPNYVVTVAVGKGEREAVPGCSVVSLESAPASDVVIYPADLSFQWLPSGAPVCFLQGFGTPGNPTVDRNLRRRHPVIASAEWLVWEAKRRGCAAYHVSYGVDRDIFFPGSPAGERDQSVLMMTHSIAWKGTEDGLEALSLVRSEFPNVQVRLFGVHEPHLPDVEFVAAPGRLVVADLMRRSAVFVCSSWEEGFGMPGLEAMTCGAAVATTDTKGSRDYAVDNESALVVPPRQPVRLAQAICTLLERPEVRNALTAGGLRRASLYPTWPESARDFDQSIVRALEQNES
jgi:glycosyltransferase involved in cell wall biosynthesis